LQPDKLIFLMLLSVRPYVRSDGLFSYTLI